MPRKGENIYKRKDGRWEGRYIRSYDSEHKAKYAYVYGKTYSEVKRKLTEQRGNVQKVQPTKNKSSTYGELLDCWLHSMQLNTKESTQARYTHLIKTHIKPHLGAVQLSQLTTDAIEIFIEQQLTDGRLDNSGGLSPKTVTDILTIIKSTIEYARYKELPVICNLSKLSIKKKEKEMRVFTPSEQESLIGTLTNDMDHSKFGVPNNFYLLMMMIELVFVGAYKILVNLIPHKTNGVPNDGYIVKMLDAHIAMRKDYALYLRIYADTFLNKAISPSDYQYERNESLSDDELLYYNEIQEILKSINAQMSKHEIDHCKGIVI